ncbi:hypothetical protein [Francisella adeliensis]|uniref:Uncharacterized protein n=1 Tax=Francisella adeliensis TaxID=2007306 RepID=A0A2Z4Y0P7_9GAMM|nr:hypothetical protein [Francisella adeliensis]AXA34456.1 hypothetical protein CDH04_08625 [Francisella adeliensis]MBK2086549.1 hypothetical protein [Francisella adeliensis]MBK2096392.1 hypothetical protein [Francisella adeliensis]QIW12703.1 hypothetical protein FZC43_08630 [Francisella adeliensis]QIW14579.1 hypothetical protein FZC44_08625 [Francisella adeliensis]
MISSDKLLAIGAALVDTVRSQIKYSFNMDEEGQLFDGLNRTSIYKNMIKKVFALNNQNLAYTPEEIGKVFLQNKTGVCDNLSLACLYIAKGLEKIKTDTFYLSLMGTPKHVFVLAHCSHDLFHLRSRSWKKYTNSFKDLASKNDLSNAVIIDPWIYKASKLENYNNHLHHAELYSVNDFYNGKIEYINQHIIISSSSPISTIDDKYIEIFNECYEIQKQKLANRRDSFARGRRFSSVRRSLEFNIQPQQKLTSLRNFFINLTANDHFYNVQWYKSSSAFYKAKKFKHSDRKGKCINSVINYLNNCIDNYDYPKDAKLLEIFKCILRILPIVRSSNRVPMHLSLDNISMTTSAKIIFNTRVTPDKRQEFEKIEGLELDWVREARYKLNERGRYKSLLEKIDKFTPSDDRGILPNFYEGKDGYYKLVHDAIDNY